MRLLIVEDDPEMLEALRRGFREEHFEVVTATNATEAIMAAVIETLAVIVLDVMLPGRNGFEVCRELRKKGIATPILLLTARDAIDDRVTGLDSGADDYLVKPFAFNELLARVRALTRRQPVLVPDVHRVADLEVDLGTRDVARGGQPVELTGKEFELLECLLRHEDKVVNRATITGYV